MKTTSSDLVSTVGGASTTPSQSPAPLADVNLWAGLVVGVLASTLRPLWSFFTDREKEETAMLKLLIANLIRRDDEVNEAIDRLTAEIRTLSSKLEK